jgi:hypothetical protein
MTVDDTTRLDVVFSQMSELLSVSNHARESISTRIITMINIFFRKCLLIDSDIHTFIHHNTNAMFDDLVVPNLLVIRSALHKMLHKFPSASDFAIYIPQDDSGTWNFTHYPPFLLPQNVSIVVKLIPTLKVSNQIDTKTLHETIESDVTAGIQPLLICCRVGTAISTVHDDLSGIIELNKDYKCWIHAEGIDAIFYCLLDPAFFGYIDSITLDLLHWVPNIKLPKMVP